MLSFCKMKNKSLFSSAAREFCILQEELERHESEERRWHLQVAFPASALTVQDVFYKLGALLWIRLCSGKNPPRQLQAPIQGLQARRDRADPPV